MNHIIRYGIFQLGQIWSLVGDDGFRAGFTTRDEALHAARTLKSVHGASGVTAEVLAQNELGELIRVPDDRPELRLFSQT